MQRGTHSAGSGGELGEIGADLVGKPGLHKVDAEDGGVSQQALELGAVGLLAEFEVLDVALRGL